MSRGGFSTPVEATRTPSSRQPLLTLANLPIPSSDPDAKALEWEMPTSTQEQSLKRPAQRQSAEAFVYRGARKTPTNRRDRWSRRPARRRSGGGAPGWVEHPGLALLGSVGSGLSHQIPLDRRGRGTTFGFVLLIEMSKRPRGRPSGVQPCPHPPAIEAIRRIELPPGPDVSTRAIWRGLIRDLASFPS